MSYHGDHGEAFGEPVLHRFRKPGRIYCDLCSANFAGHSGIWYHKKHIHGCQSQKANNTINSTLFALTRPAKLRTFSCSHCGKKFNRHDMLRLHMLESHAINEESVVASSSTAVIEKSHSPEAASPVSRLSDSENSWIFRRKDTWRRHRRRRFYKKKFAISESTISTVLGAVRYLLENKHVDSTHLRSLRSEQTLTRLVSRTIKKRYVKYKTNDSEERKKEYAERAKKYAVQKKMAARKWTKPKSVTNPFLQFSRERRNKEPSYNKLGRATMMMKLSKEWTEMPLAQRQPYVELAIADQIRYDKEINEWKLGKDFHVRKNVDPHENKKNSDMSVQIEDSITSNSAPMTPTVTTMVASANKGEDVVGHSDSETQSDSETEDECGMQEKPEVEPLNGNSMLTNNHRSSSKYTSVANKPPQGSFSSTLDADVFFLSQPVGAWTHPDSDLIRSGFSEPSLSAVLPSDQGSGERRGGSNEGVFDTMTLRQVSKCLEDMLMRVLNDDYIERMNTLEAARRCNFEQECSMKNMFYLLKSPPLKFFLSPSVLGVVTCLNETIKCLDLDSISSPTVRALHSDPAEHGMYATKFSRDYPTRMSSIGGKRKRSIIDGDRYARPKRITLRECTVKYKVVEPGTNVLSVIYKNRTEHGSLAADGTIQYTIPETNQVVEFDAPSAFSLFVKRRINPSKKADEGWHSVLYRGKPIDAARRRAADMGKDETTECKKKKVEHGFSDVSTPGMFDCCICGAKYKGSSGIFRHLKRRHPAIESAVKMNHEALIRIKKVELERESARKAAMAVKSSTGLSSGEQDLVQVTGSVSGAQTAPKIDANFADGGIMGYGATDSEGEDDEDLAPICLLSGPYDL
jgi:hypothetical protein